MRPAQSDRPACRSPDNRPTGRSIHSRFPPSTYGLRRSLFHFGFAETTSVARDPPPAADGESASLTPESRSLQTCLCRCRTLSARFGSLVAPYRVAHGARREPSSRNAPVDRSRPLAFQRANLAIQVNLGPFSTDPTDCFPGRPALVRPANAVPSFIGLWPPGARRVGRL